MSEKLKRCPFCGGEAKLYSIGTGSPHYGNYHQVVCQGCLTASGAYWSGEQSAIDAWNTRHVETCELEINIDMTAVQCSKCGYLMPKGTNLTEVDFCMKCGRKVEK